MANEERQSPERVKIFEGLKQEIITQGLSVQTPADFEVFSDRLRAFIEGPNAPLFVKVEMLKILETQTRSGDVRSVVTELKKEVREETIALTASDRVDAMREYTEFSVDAKDPRKLEEMIGEIETYLDDQEPPKQSFEDIKKIGDDIVHEAKLREMESEAKEGAGERIGDEAEEFLRREAEGE